MLTSAYLALRLFEPDFEPVVTPFDQIEDAVVHGKVDVGLLIHEGQLTFADKVCTSSRTSASGGLARPAFPFPSAATSCGRTLGDDLTRKISRHLRDSIAYGLEHRTAALDHSMQYARGLDRSKADTFVGMYVNDWTLDYGERGRQAVRDFPRARRRRRPHHEASDGRIRRLSTIAAPSDRSLRPPT